MSTESAAALDAQRQMITRSDHATKRVMALWNRVDPANLDASWLTLGPQITAAVAEVQVSDAVTAGRMTATVGRAQGVDPGDVIVPQAFSRVDGSGRDLESLLHGSVTTTKQGVSRGLGLVDAYLSGAAYLGAMAKTAMADVGRSSQFTAATGRGFVRYVRVVNAGACSRCAILAGSDRFRTSFQRHPACRCTTVPVKSDEVPDGLFGTPGDYFDSLSPAEQDRVFTKAGAESIRLGANPVSVVSARRGTKRMRTAQAMPGSTLTAGRASMQRTRIGRRPDGSPIMGFVTTEGASRRGSFGRTQAGLGAGEVRQAGARYTSTKRARLMPETIIDLTEDVNTRRLLLRDAGYLDHRLDYSTNAWVQERTRLQLADRAAADEFYSSVGVRLS